VLRDPSNAMATFALEQIDNAVNLFTSLTQHGGNTPRYRRNLQWLQKLHARASAKLSTVSETQRRGSQRAADPDQQANSEEKEEGEDFELLGWRTRLIERVGQGRPTITSIGLPPTPAGSQVTNMSNPAPNQDHLDDQKQSRDADAAMAGASLSFTASDPTDVLVRAGIPKPMTDADTP
jgi:hypothetical protein